MADLTPENWREWGSLRTYAAENWAETRADRKGIPNDCERTDVPQVCSAVGDWVSERWGFEKPSFRWITRKGHRSSAAVPTLNRVLISNRVHRLNVIAHEYAHIVAFHNFGTIGHARDFQAANLIVTQHVVGPEYAAILEAGYRKAGLNPDGERFMAHLLALY